MKRIKIIPREVLEFTMELYNHGRISLELARRRAFRKYNYLNNMEQEFPTFERPVHIWLKN